MLLKFMDKSQIYLLFSRRKDKTKNVKGQNFMAHFYFYLLFNDLN